MRGCRPHWRHCLCPTCRLLRADVPADVLKNPCLMAPKSISYVKDLGLWWDDSGKCGCRSCLRNGPSGSPCAPDPDYVGDGFYYYVSQPSEEWIPSLAFDRLRDPLEEVA